MTVTRTSAAARTSRYAVAVGCAIAIGYASIVEPSGSIPRTLFGVEFTVYLHVIAYAGLTAAIGYAYDSAERRALFVVVALATLYGAAIELLQGTISYRTMSAADAAINALGAVFGAGFWWHIAPRVGVGRRH